MHLLTSTSRAGTLLLFYGSHGLLEGFFHRFPSRLLNLLFLSFVVIQFRYFFGGATSVVLTPGLTYSEYARRGFFELVAVAALVLPLLLTAHWLLDKQKPESERAFRWLAGTQIMFLFVIMASAFQRMRLYQREYGLTEQRLYPTAFMGWLAIVFVWFVVSVLRGRRERFAFGALAAGFAVILALHALNPDDLIARVNTNRRDATVPFDGAHPPRTFGDKHAPVRNEGQRPGMLEPTGDGLDADGPVHRSRRR